MVVTECVNLYKCSKMSNSNNVENNDDDWNDKTMTTKYMRTVSIFGEHGGLQKYGSIYSKQHSFC